MCDLLEDRREDAEFVRIKEEAQRIEDHYRNIGFKMGLDQSRKTSIVQAGFDDGYAAGAITGFFHSFVEITKKEDVSQSFKDALDTEDGLPDRIKHLEELYECFQENAFASTLKTLAGSKNVF